MTGGEVNRDNFRDQILNFEAVEQEIANWAAGTARPFAGMPRPTEPGYESRMRKAYEETVGDIETLASESQTLAAGVILGRMCAQATGFASRLKIDDAKFDPRLGPKHLVAGLPAVVAGQYRQIRESGARMSWPT